MKEALEVKYREWYWKNSPDDWIKKVVADIQENFLEKQQYMNDYLKIDKALYSLYEMLGVDLKMSPGYRQKYACEQIEKLKNIAGNHKKCLERSAIAGIAKEIVVGTGEQTSILPNKIKIISGSGQDLIVMTINDILAFIHNHASAFESIKDSNRKDKEWGIGI